MGKPTGRNGREHMSQLGKERVSNPWFKKADKTPMTCLLLTRQARLTRGSAVLKEFQKILKKVLTHFCASDKTSGSTTGKNKE
jgi:hypothetical protein